MTGSTGDDQRAKKTTTITSTANQIAINYAHMGEYTLKGEEGRTNTSTGCGTTSINNQSDMQNIKKATKTQQAVRYTA